MSDDPFATKLYLTLELRQGILDHAESTYPLEACGFAAGLENRIQKIIPVRNIETGNDRFRMNPEDHVRAIHWMEGHELQMLAIYHSHPLGPEEPSILDIVEFHYPGVLVIICSYRQRGWLINAYRIRDNHFCVVPVHMTEDG